MSEAELDVAIKTATLSASQKKASASTLGLGTAFKGLWLQIKNTTTAMWTFLTTTSAGYATMILGAVMGIVVLYNHFTTSVKEAKKSLKESIESIDSINKEVKSLEDELSSCKQKAKELQEQINNGANSTTYAEELQLLREQTKELERQLIIKKEEQRLTARDTADDVDKSFNASFFSWYDSSGQFNKRETKNNDPVQELGNTLEALKNLRKEYADTEAELARNSSAALYNSQAHPELGIKAHPEMAELFDKNVENNKKELENLDAKLNAASEHALEFYNLLELQKDALDGLTEAGYTLTEQEKYRYAYVSSTMRLYENYLNEVNNVEIKSPVSNQIQEAKDAMGSTSNNDEPKTFSQLIEGAQTFQEAINTAGDSLNKLMSGDYTNSSELLTYIANINNAMNQIGKNIDWESISSIDELEDKIKELSDGYVDKFLQDNNISPDSDFAKMLRAIASEAMDASDSLSDLNNSIDSLQSAYGSLTDIIKEYNSTGTLTLDNLQALLSLEPEYLNCLVSENGQLAINSEALNLLFNQRIADAKAQAVQNAISQINTLAENANAQAKQNNASAAEAAKIKMDNYNLSLGETVKQAFASAGAVATLNAALDGASDAGVSEEDIQNVMNTFAAQLDAIDKIAAAGAGVSLGKSAKKSGKKDADAYLEAFEKELKKLDKSWEYKKITEKQYLDQLRVKLCPVI